MTNDEVPNGELCVTPSGTFRHSPKKVVIGPSALSLAERINRPGVDISDHVQVVVVNIDHLTSIFVAKRVRHWPANPANVLVVDRALVVSVMLLRRADQRVDPRRIEVVSNFFLNNANVVTTVFVQERYTPLNGPRFLERPNHFVVARWIERGDFTTGDRAQNWHAFVPFVVPELVFLLL